MTSFFFVALKGQLVFLVKCITKYFAVNSISLIGHKLIPYAHSNH